HVTENLGARCFGQLPVAINVDQCTLFLALIAVEDSQRDAHVEAERLLIVWIVEGWIVGIPGAESWISRPVGVGKFMVGNRLLNGLKRRPQIGPVIKCYLAESLQRLQLLREIEWTDHVEF